MRTLIRFFLDHGLLVKIIFFSVMLYGSYSMVTAQKEGFPAVQLNTITVATPYPGASTDDVELNLTTRLEEEIAEVNGLYEVTSTSRENFSVITIQADESATKDEMRVIADDVQNAVDRTQDLPIELDSLPVVTVWSTVNTPIISINLFGEHADLRQTLPILERGIEAIEGVSGVDKIGYFDREVHIEIDPIKARKLRISISDVVRAIEARNLRTTGGTLESFLNQRTVVTLNKFNSLADVEDVILRSDITGQSVRVRDLANVTLREKDETLIVRNEGRAGMNLVVRKRESADIIDTLERVKQFMQQQSMPESVGYTYSNDQSARTRLRLQVLGGNALLGFALVTIILLLALNLSSAFWTAVSVPFSLFGAFILLPYLGVTVNIVSLAGFVLVLGLLVDDAIVVAEKITSYRENGMSGKEAALKGAQEMSLPVIVASITTILAFSPMFSLGGIPGKFAWAIPAVVIVALLVSLLESFFILPHHLANGRIKKNKGKPAWIKSLENGYSVALHTLLHARYLVVLGMILLLVGTLFFAKSNVKFQFFPQDGVETFFVKLEMPRGASIAATEARLIEFENAISQLPDSELESYATRVGLLSTKGNSNRGDHSHWGVISVYLTGESVRDRTADEIINALRPRFIAGAGERIIFDKQRVGPPIGAPVEINVSSNDDALRDQTADSVMAYLKTLPGVIDSDSTNKPGKNRLLVTIDHQRLAEVGLTVKDVSEALRVTFDGMIVSSTTSVEETVDYRVVVGPEFQNDPNMIYRIPVSNKKGKVLTLRDVVSMKEEIAPLEVQHVNGLRTTTLSASIDSNVTTVLDVQRKVKERFSADWAQYPQLKVGFVGEARETKKIFGGFITASLVALASIFLVVAILFNSMGQPFIVMSVIPFAIIGVIWAFYFHGMPMSFFSIMGTLGLIGVVVNDTIIMVTEVNKKLSEHATNNLVNTVIAGAKNRLRPVLLTSMTTVVGLLPTAYGLGGSDALIIPLTLSMAYGLAFATLITLVLTPSLVVIGHDVGRLLGRGSNHTRGKKINHNI
jgi:multidrug efflux pump subunit AcrB